METFDATLVGCAAVAAVRRYGYAARVSVSEAGPVIAALLTVSVTVAVSITVTAAAIVAVVAMIPVTVSAAAVIAAALVLAAALINVPLTVIEAAVLVRVLSVRSVAVLPVISRVFIRRRQLIVRLRLDRDFHRVRGIGLLA